MNRLVLDASMALSWCFPDEATPSSKSVLRSLLEAQAVVPAIWPLEVVNALLVAERRRRLPAGDVARFLALLESLEVQVEAPPLGRVLVETLSLGRRYGLSAYDAAYLELAIRESLPLATLDEVLSKAARKAGVRVM